MKKLLFLLLTVLTLCVRMEAQQGYDGFFFEANYYDNIRLADPTEIGLAMPQGDIGTTTNSNAPLGSGVAILALLGTGYALRKRNVFFYSNNFTAAENR